MNEFSQRRGYLFAGGAAGGGCGGAVAAAGSAHAAVCFVPTACAHRGGGGLLSFCPVTYVRTLHRQAHTLYRRALDWMDDGVN